MTQKEKIINKATKYAAELLISLMINLEIPNFIETTIVYESTKQKYKLRIERL